MFTKLKFLLSTVFVMLMLQVVAQDSSSVHFIYSKKRLNDKEVLLQIKAIVQPGSKLFSINKSSEDVPFSEVDFDSSKKKYFEGKVLEEAAIKKEKVKEFSTELAYITDSVLWTQKVALAATDSVVFKGSINFLVKKGEEYNSGVEQFKFFVQKEQAGNVSEDSAKNEIHNKSLWWIFLAAFVGGLLALLTPCVYSMIPVTVSFFTKRSKTKAEGIRNAVYYAISIIAIFTLLGFFVTLIFGPAALNNLATNWIANLIFFALFLIFGFSFLGAFEINLPSSWTNSSDSKANTNGFLGIFFMALTLVLVSFSCTGPIIGNLLVLAAKGNFFGPLVGMFGFSLALALPFALFAFFPSKLNVLGKAGGWLNSVKVTLGFLELALALKFLSNADLVKGWRILDREVFLTLWIVIFSLLGIYLLGKIKFHHDDELPKNDFGKPYLTVTRLMFAIISLSFSVYMIPGLWGAPLKSVSAFVPPMGTQDFVINLMSGHIHSDKNSDNTNTLPHPVKYYDQMKIYEPEVVTKYGMVTYFDYKEALEISRKMKRPLMLDFTGINCVNCRKMEGQVWSDPAVMKRLKENFVIVSLYVDVQNIDLQENEQYFSNSLGRKVETLGDKNADMQISLFGANSQPYYFFLDSNEKKLAPNGYGYDPDINKFMALLDEVKANYDKNVK